MPRLQSEVSAGKAGKKGSALNAVGDDPLAQVKSMGMLLGHQQADLSAVVSTPKGASLAQDGGRGAPPQMPGSNILQGHHDHPVGHAAKGKSPKRSGGSKTPSAAEIIRKGME